MKFTQRLAYYLLGLLIGSTIVLWFMDSKGTSFCYLPNCRVLKDLRSKPLHTTPEAKEALAIYSLEDVKSVLNDGNVNFSKSDISEENGKTYIVDGFGVDGKPLTVEMVNYSDKVILKQISETK